MQPALFILVCVATSLICLAAASAAEEVGGKAKKLEMDPEAKVAGPVFKKEKQVWGYKVTSPYLKGENEVEVLLPDTFDKAKQYRVLYVLPVEPGIGGYFGDGLQEMRKADVHNRYDLICVAMAFDTVPWFGAHATDPQIRHEDHLMKVVVPLVESRCPTLGTREGRLLLGFSKSGWGAFSLILRNPGFFGYACSWDAPLMVEWPGNWGIKEHFGTQENFEKYQIPRLFEKQASLFKKRTRLVLLGEMVFGAADSPDTRGHAVLAHEKMTELGIRHAYRNDLKIPHQWKSDAGPDKGWEKPAVDMLMEIANAPEPEK